MDFLRFDCNCDTVASMEDLGVTTEDILQYAYAVLPRKQVHDLVRGLESMLDRVSEIPVAEAVGESSL